MSDSNMFRQVLRGYDPALVERHIRELQDTNRSHREQADHLRLRITALEEALSNAEAGTGQTPIIPMVPQGSGNGDSSEEVEALQTQLQQAQAELDRVRSDAETRAADNERLAAELDSTRVELKKRAESTSHDHGDSYGAPTTFDHLGARIAQILTLAEEEAAETRASAESDAQSARHLAQEEANKAREEADRYAEERRQAADVDSARAVEEARRSADEMLDAAERDATARREEAEALYEQQRARAAQAAADFEMTLAQRRERAEQDFAGRTTAAEAQIAALVEQGDAQRLENERSRADAERTVQRLIADAQQQAQELVAAAKIRADKIRAESERELAAAAQRRDSINAQLTNVRQMLATLSGTSQSEDPFAQFDNDILEVDVTDAEPASERNE